jgi:hypothetical protein
MDRTRRWWIMRIELVIGLAAVGLGIVAYMSMPALVLTEPSPRGDALVLAGLIGLAIGLILMILVFVRHAKRPAD